jgi:CheY-like chemotaxis protein
VVLTARDLSEDERARLRPHVEAIARKGDLLRAELIGKLDRALRPELAPPRSTRGRVLVVDDHDLNRELVRSILERRGYEVLQADDGVAGVVMAHRSRPDVILMDLAMPRKDGFAATRELKADQTTRAIPIVALTALAMRGDEDRALAAAASCTSPTTPSWASTRSDATGFLPPSTPRAPTRATSDARSSRICSAPSASGPSFARRCSWTTDTRPRSDRGPSSTSMRSSPTSVA